MKTSTEIQSTANHVGEERAIELIAKAGFDAWDFSMFHMCRYNYATRQPVFTDHPLAGSNYLAFARQLRSVGSDNGIHCNQSHAPFPSFCPEIRSYLKRAIECTAEAGGNICIIHPNNDETPQQNAEMYQELLPFAKEHGVKIATENMWNWDSATKQPCFAACSTPESFNAHLDAVNDEFLVACLDIGHAEIRTLNTSAVEMICSLGSRLQALHIHDTDLFHDSHQIPFSMQIDFHKIVQALKEIHYSGYFTLEADTYLRAHTPENVFEGVKEMSKAARRLADMFEA